MYLPQIVTSPKKNYLEKISHASRTVCATSEKSSLAVMFRHEEVGNTIGGNIITLSRLKIYTG